MFSLILVIISIALFVAFLTATSNHIPVDVYIRANIQMGVQQGIKSLEGTATRYFLSTRDHEGYISYPGNGVNLMTVATPGFGYRPANVRGAITWEMTTGSFMGMEAVAICVKPLNSFTDLHAGAIEAVQNSLPPQSSFRSSTCGATSNSGGTHLTYWVPLAHMNTDANAIN